MAKRSSAAGKGKVEAAERKDYYKSDPFLLMCWKEEGQLTAVLQVEDLDRGFEFSLSYLTGDGLRALRSIIDEALAEWDNGG
jgi:hypothetical protein